MAAPLSNSKLSTHKGQPATKRGRKPKPIPLNTQIEIISQMIGALHCDDVQVTILKQDYGMMILLDGVYGCPVCGAWYLRGEQCTNAHLADKAA